MRLRRWYLMRKRYSQEWKEALADNYGKPREDAAARDLTEQIVKELYAQQGTSQPAAGGADFPDGAG